MIHIWALNGGCIPAPVRAILRTMLCATGLVPENDISDLPRDQVLQEGIQLCSLTRCACGTVLHEVG